MSLKVKTLAPLKNIALLFCTVGLESKFLLLLLKMSPQHWIQRNSME
jgi:hypothetical protein